MSLSIINYINYVLFSGHNYGLGTVDMCLGLPDLEIPQTNLRVLI